MLQPEADVVRHLHAHVRGQNALDLHKVLLAEEVGANFVRQQQLVVLLRHLLHALDEGVLGALAHQHVHVLLGHEIPAHDDVHRDEGAAGAVGPPQVVAKGGGHTGRGQGHDVREDVVEVVLGQRQRGAGVVPPPQRRAVEEERRLHRRGRPEHAVGHQVEVDVGGLAMDKPPPEHGERALNHLDGADGHDARGDDHADGLQAGLADGVAGVVVAGVVLGEGEDALREDVDHGVRERRHDGVGQRQHVDGQLRREQRHVRAEGEVDRDGDALRLGTRRRVVVVVVDRASGLGRLVGGTLQAVVRGRGEQGLPYMRDMVHRVRRRPHLDVADDPPGPPGRRRRRGRGQRPSFPFPLHREEPSAGRQAQRLAGARASKERSKEGDSLTCSLSNNSRRPRRLRIAAHMRASTTPPAGRF
mmetsp:Transcript_764/g.2039  ORF Transcript_764/g.2039 Transcript_764/m.2039 type:complete len:416 (+) Transcript_764:1105-2352(+)